MSNFFILRQTKEEWEAEDTARPANYVGVESDVVNGVETGTLQAKLFDGMNPWNELEYWNPDGGSGGGGGGTVNARTENDPTLHAINELIAPDGTISGSTVDLTGSIIVPTPGVNIHYLSSYANFAQAISSIGSAPSTLIIDIDAVVITGLTIPDTLMLEQQNGSTINISAAGSLNFAGIGIRGDETAFITATSIPTFVWCSPGVVNITPANLLDLHDDYNLVNGQMIRYRLYNYVTPSTPPVPIGGLTPDGLYYIIRVSSTTVQLATSFSNALAGIPVTLTTQGFQNFFLDTTPIAWTGTEWPDRVSTELLDIGDNSESTRALYLTIALAGKSVWIDVYPRVMDNAVRLADGHSVLMKGGVHENTFIGSSGNNGSGGQWPYYPFYVPWTLGSDGRFTSDPDATFMESSVNGVNALVYMREGANNSRIDHNSFLGQGATFNGVSGGLVAGSGNNNYIGYNVLDGCSSYNISVVPSGNFDFSDVPTYVTVEHNTLRNFASQVLFIGAGKFINFFNNYVDLNGLTVPGGGVSFTIFDFEPNSSKATITDIRIEGNTFDVRNMTNPGFMFSAIRLNPAGIAGFERVYLRDNVLIGADQDNTPADNHIRNFIEVIGADTFVISGNRCYGIASNAGMVGIEASRRGKIFDNEAINGGGAIAIQGSNEIEFFSNRFVPVTDYGSPQQAATISEVAPSVYPIGSYVAELATCYYNPGFLGQVYQHQTGVRGYLNTHIYTAASVHSGNFYSGSIYGQFTMTESITEPGPVFTFNSATDVNIATNALLKTSHGLLTGASLNYGNTSSVIIGGLSQFITYWVIRIDADHIQLAATYDDAVAVIPAPIDLTSTGTGTQDFALVFVIWPYDNDYHENPDYPITLAPNSTSMVRTPNTPIVLPATTTFTTVDITKSGITYDNTGMADLAIFILPTTALVGNEFAFSVVEPSGIQVRVYDDTLLYDGDTITGVNGFTMSTTVGSYIKVKRMTDSWSVIEKVGMWDTPDYATATAIHRIDCGRLAGGTVAGWEQDTFFTGGASQSPGIVSNLTHVDTPPTAAVFSGFYRRGGSPIQYDFSGLNASKKHVVRMHWFANYDPSYNGVNMRMAINGSTVLTDFAPNHFAYLTTSANYIAWVFDYVVPAGSTTLQSQLFIADAGDPYISGIEVYELNLAAETLGALGATSLNLGGATLLDILTATASLDFDLSGVATQDLTIGVSGAALGDAVALGIQHGSVTTDTLFNAWVSSADVVTVRATRISGTPNPASGTFRVVVLKF